MVFSKIDKLKQQLDALRPLPPHIVKSLQENLLVEWTYNSNAIEGNTLTLKETKVVLEGVTIGGKSMTEHLEAINHKEAILFVERIVQEREQFSERTIKDLHQLVLKKIDDVNAGAYRKENVRIAGAQHIPPDFTQLSGEMSNLIKWYDGDGASLHPVERASLLHSLFVKIHPFVDGNGRTARLLLNFELMKYGYPPVVIKKESRLDYYDLLDTSHTTDNHEAFIQFIAQLEEEALQSYLTLVDAQNNQHQPTTPGAPDFKEDHISQIPALQLLQNLGYTYLTPDEALKQRGNKLSNVILEDILRKQIGFINHFTYKGKRHSFTDGVQLSATQALKSFRFDGLIRTNEQMYDLICLGKSFEQTIEGDTKSFTLNYIDWKNPENNVFHVTEEFKVECTGGNGHRIPDIVLFINGIPFCIIECKRPDIKDSLKKGVEQLIGYQRDDRISKLFVYSQLLMAINKNEAKFATTGTPDKFWSVWKEDNIDATVDTLTNTPLSNEQNDKLFSDRYKYVRTFFEQQGKEHRLVTEQDKALYSLCQPQRLLELTYQYIIYETGAKKIARYQQYNAVQKTIQKVVQIDKNRRRNGGVIWHTQGSGKSLTMVMLAKALILEPSIKNPKVVIVTDRDDLDKQIKNTFQACGKEPVRATSGSKLGELIKENKEAIITTLIHKFNAILKREKVSDESNNIFVLVDEGHRSQYGSFHVKMQKVFPNACFIGFTGTPLMKKEKNTAAKFGGIIDTYPINQAVKDKAVVPLLYEGRHVEQKVHAKELDSWWERICKDLTQEQQADLKKKFARADQLNKADKKIARIAYDIGDQFKRHWQRTGFKAQLATDSKASALKYKKYLDEFGMVSSEVIISAPDMREGYSEIDEESNSEVVNFWEKMKKRFGNEEKYNEDLIAAFKGPDDPEIIIVVDKLLTGFDAPTNTVLYIAKNLREHSLLQAIARVNRLSPGKDYGYIVDYYGVLGELDDALETYGGLGDFEDEDLADTLTNISEELKTLPQKHSDLWDIFKTIENKKDEEAYERHLGDDSIRDKFYKRLTEYGKTLKLALSTVSFSNETPEAKIKKYTNDLKFFVNLRGAVKRRYAETIDYGEYEGKIQKLIDEYVGANEITNITELVNIFDKEKFEEEILKVDGIGARADTIANRTQKSIDIKMDEDPAFYKKFSKLLKEVINEYRQRRIDEAEYLEKVTDIMNKVRDKEDSGIPYSVRNNDDARAFYGHIYDSLQEARAPYGENAQELAAEAGLSISGIVDEHKIVDWQANQDVQKKMEQKIDDYLFKMKEANKIDLEIVEIDSLLTRILETAKTRSKLK